MPRPGFRPSLAARLTMLAASYAPLLALLALLNSFKIQWLRWAFVGVAAASVVGTVWFFTIAIRGVAATAEPLSAVKPREGEALKFFSSYVVPFFVAPTAPAATRSALLVYLVLIASLYVQGDLYFGNPIAALLGYRLFEVTRTDGGYMVVVSRAHELQPGAVVRLRRISSYVYAHALDGP